jgi:hypothetical protein
MDIAVLMPVFAMAGLSFIVWLRLYQTRLAEMKSKRIHPQRVASSSGMAQLVEDSRAADNFRNLFELPVLFYVAVLMAAVSGIATDLFLALAWTFVVLRIVHSVIHCTYNRVMHRFTAYLLSSLVLWAIWVFLALHLLAQ